MDTFSNIVYMLLPWALGLIGIVCVAIIVMKIRLHILESKPKQKPEEVIVVDGRTKRNSS